MRIVLPRGARNLYGPAIRRAREQSRLRMTQTDLAETLTSMGLPMDRSAISRIENQQRALNDIELRIIVEALRINLQKLDTLMLENRGLIPAYATFRMEDIEEFHVRVAEEETEEEDFSR